MKILEAVDAFVDRAIGFYRRLGATSMDEWTTNRLSGDALREAGAE